MTMGMARLCEFQESKPSYTLQRDTSYKGINSLWWKGSSSTSMRRFLTLTGMALIGIVCVSDVRLGGMATMISFETFSRMLLGTNNMKLFVCGSELGEERRKYFFVWYGVKVLSDAFPEIEDPIYNPPRVLRKNLDVEKHRAGEHDIMLIFQNQFGCNIAPDDFPGRTVVMSDQPIEKQIKGMRSYHIGSIDDSFDTLMIPPATMVINVWDESDQEKLFIDDKKPKNSQKHFLMYAQSNCGIKYREEAFDDLSEIGHVHQGGACWGLKHDRSKLSEHITMDRESGKKRNRNIYKDYRFALVMENKNHPGFISERIINSFLSGAIPIWYGTQDIFKIFNKDAFIYYDVEDSKLALNKIAYLEYNRTAYDEMLEQPILAEGETTIDRWFSFNGKVGDSSLKRRIRSMMGYESKVHHLSLLPLDHIEPASNEFNVTK